MKFDFNFFPHEWDYFRKKCGFNKRERELSVLLENDDGISVIEASQIMNTSPETIKRLRKSMISKIIHFL